MNGQETSGFITADGDKLNRDNWKGRRQGMVCETCVFFVPKETHKTIDPKGLLGRCRRRAPTMNGFPVVFETDWCGDHKLKERES